MHARRGARSRIRRLPGVLPLALVASVVALGVGACGGGDDAPTAETTTTTGETTPVGREIFVANCGSCHTLADAGTSGTAGPNLDELELSAEGVEEQVRSGGGGMPAFEDSLSDEEIVDVAAYVAAAGNG